MVKIIFFDIDGTLVNKHAKALSSTKKAIKAAQQQGILCGIATGRGPLHLSEQIDSLNLDVFVTYNGQLVYTKEEVLYEQAFEKATVKKLITFGDHFHRQMMFGGKDKIEGSSLMKFGQNTMAKKLARFLPKQFPVGMVKNLMIKWRSGKKDCRYHEMDILNDVIYQCVLLSPESETDFLKRQLPECHITRSNPYIVDIIPKGGSKLVGIKKCIAHWDIPLSEVMVFGDNWNDVEMIRGTGIGVAMGNAPAEVKKEADFVTDTNERDGIFQAFKHYGLIQGEE